MAFFSYLPFENMRPVGKQLLLIAFFAFFVCSKPKAQQSRSIDSLIAGIPAMMRSNEDKARQMIAELEQQSTRWHHRHGIIQSTFYKAWLSYRHNTADTTINSIDSALRHIEGINADTALIKFYILKGQCFVKKTEFDKALENFKRALNIAEKRNDQASKTGTLVSIGWAYMEDGKPNEAIPIFNEALALNPSPEYENKALLLCNIASCYNTIGNFKLAELQAQKGIAIARTRGDNTDLANGLNILGRSYYQQGKIDKAISILKDAAIVRKKISDPSMLASDYLELADLYLQNHQPAQAIEWAKKSEALSVRSANNLKLTGAYQSLATAYESVGDYKNASKYLKQLLVEKDSLKNEEYSKAFAEMQVQFETQKRKAENLELKKENLEIKLESTIQHRWLLVLIGGLILLFASGVYVIKLMKSRYKTRLALEQLREQKKRTMAVIETEEKERRRIAADLHDVVGQTLAAAAVQLNKAGNGQTSLHKVDELINQACTEVRNLSHQVTPELLLTRGLAKTMEQAVGKLNDVSDKMGFTLFTHIEQSLDDDLLSLTVYRCFQELSTNIIKHAKATTVTVQLNLLADEIQLIVEDDGIGFQPEKTVYGLGIKNIENRVALYDGEFEIDSIPGKGSTFIIGIKRVALNKTLNKLI